MFEWNTSDMRLKNMSATELKALEKSVPDEDKLTFVNSKDDGLLMYINNLIKLFHEQQASLKTKDGVFKQRSLLAWIRKNDPRHVINRGFRLGEFYCYSQTFWLQHRKAPVTKAAFRWTLRHYCIPLEELYAIKKAVATID